MKRVAVKKKDSLPKISRKYTPLKMIGRGSFGVVFLVRRQSDSRQCVMKLVDTSMLSEKDRQDAKNECEVLQKLRRHPHIIRMYEHYTEEDGKLAIVMEYADGGDLSQRIDVQKQAGGAGFGSEQVLDWFVQICLALKHAHDRKVMHRDLKPQNIFLTRENYVRLGDFGISKVLGSTLSVAHTCVGTPLYLAPELCEGKEYNNRCDVWSLGVILYELLTLKLPFHANNMPALVMQIVGGTYPALPPSTPRDLCAVIDDCLRKDPSRRPHVHDILERDFVKARVTKFLDEKLIRSEFSQLTPQSSAETAETLSGPDPSACTGSGGARASGQQTTRAGVPVPSAGGGYARASRPPPNPFGPGADAAAAAGSGGGARATPTGSGSGGVATARRSESPARGRRPTAPDQSAPTSDSAAAARAVEREKLKELQAKYDEQRAKMRRDRLARQQATAQWKAAEGQYSGGRVGEVQVEVFVPTHSSRTMVAPPPQPAEPRGAEVANALGVAPPNPPAALANALGATLVTSEQPQPATLAATPALPPQRRPPTSEEAEALQRANPGWRLISDEEMAERLASLNEQREAVMRLVDNCALTGEAARQLVNSAQREMRQIAADIGKLRARFVLVPAAEDSPPAPPDSPAAAAEELVVMLPPGVEEADVAILYDPRDDGEELGEDIATVFQQLATTVGTGGGSGADAARPPKPPSQPAPVHTGRAGLPSSATNGGATESPQDEQLQSRRMGTGGFAWEIDASPSKPARRRVPTGRAEEGASAGSNGGAAPLAGSGAGTPCAAPVASSGAGGGGGGGGGSSGGGGSYGGSGGMPPSLLRVPTDATLRQKAGRLREILAQQLGGASKLDDVMRVAREEEAGHEGEGAVKTLLGEKAAILLPVVHTLVDLEECLPHTMAASEE